MEPAGGGNDINAVPEFSLIAIRGNHWLVNRLRCGYMLLAKISLFRALAAAARLTVSL